MNRFKWLALIAVGLLTVRLYEYAGPQAFLGGLKMAGALFFMVTVHELCHWIELRRSGIPVPEFAIGLGPKLFVLGRLWNTEFQWRTFPLGGLVDPDKESFAAASRWTRARVFAAGPLGNLALALMLTFPTYWLSGVENYRTTDAYIYAMGAPSIARDAGLEEGDIVRFSAGQPITNPQQLVDSLRASTDTPLELTIERSGSLQKIVIKPDSNGRIGAQLMSHEVKTVRNVGLIEAAKLSVVENVKWIGDSLSMVGSLLHGQHLGDMSSVVGIVQTGSRQVGAAFNIFCAHISAAVGVTNGLPIPLLDGGYLFIFLPLEWLLGRPVQEKTQEKLALGGALLLAAITVISFNNDMERILGPAWAPPVVASVAALCGYYVLKLIGIDLLNWRKESNN